MKVVAMIVPARGIWVVRRRMRLSQIGPTGLRRGPEIFQGDDSRCVRSKRTAATHYEGMRGEERNCALHEAMAHYEIATNRFATADANARLSEQVSAFVAAVYRWMCAGLAITAVTAWYVASSPQLALTIATNRPVFWALVIALRSA
jgi:hypothetical protein